MKDTLMLVTLMLSGVWILRWLGVLDRIRGIRSIDAIAAGELVKTGAVVLDVRTDGEFAATRIPDARHLPLSEIKRRLAELEPYRGKPIVVSCRSGSRSVRACAILRKNGFEAYNLKGGLIAWARSGLRLED